MGFFLIEIPPVPELPGTAIGGVQGGVHELDGEGGEPGGRRPSEVRDRVFQNDAYAECRYTIERGYMNCEYNLAYKVDPWDEGDPSGNYYHTGNTI